MPQISQGMRQDAQKDTQNINNSGINALIGLLQNLQQGQPSGQSGQQKPQANAYQKGADKALNEFGYAHASEALMKGQDPMMIAQQSSQMGMQQANSNMQPLLQSLLAMAQQPQQVAPQQPAQQKYGNTSKGLLSRLVGMDLNPENTGLQLDNQIKQQQLRGEQPLQQGDKEKLTYDFANEINKELMKSNNPDALTPEVSAKFNLLIEGSDAVKEAANLLKEDSGVQWSLPNFMKSQKSRQYELAVKRMIDNKNRLETGASMNKEELDKAYQKYKPGKTDNQETIRRRLQPLSKFYEGSLNTADPTGIHRKRASGDSNKETTIGRFQVRYH